MSEKSLSQIMPLLKIGDLIKFEIFGGIEYLEIEYVEDGSIGGMNANGEYGELYHDTSASVIDIFRKITIS